MEAKHKLGTLFVGLLMLASAVGCGGLAAPSSTPVAPQTSATISRYGAPVVIGPRDLESRGGSPCNALLTKDQLRRLGLQPESAREVPLADSVECSWQGLDFSLSLGAETRRDLLVDTYRTHLFGVFEPTTISGLPAVRQKTSPQVNICTVTTGVAEHQALEVTWFGRATAGRADDSCGLATRVTEVVIGGLPRR